MFYSIVEMDQLTESLIEESYRRSREVCKEIEDSDLKNTRIIPDTQNKKRKKEALEENIKKLKKARDDLFDYRNRLRDPNYRVGPG